MAIFNSYVKLPEGNQVGHLTQAMGPGKYVSINQILT